MANSIIDGLFGPSPDQLRQQQQEAINQQAMQYARMAPFERASMGMYQAGAGLAKPLAGMLGGVNPQEQQALRAQQVMSEGDTDLSTSKGLLAKAEQFRKVGDLRTATMLALKGKEVEKDEQSAALAARKQDFQEKEAMQFKRDQLAQNAELRKMQLEQVAEAARLRSEDSRYSADQRAEAAREATAARLQLGQLMAEIRKLGIESKIAGASEKIGQKEKALQEGKEGLEGDITAARNIIGDLSKSGGITSTERGALANTLTSIATSGVGQAMGRTVGTADQSKRDQLKSLRLQMLNSIKQATGMGSAQLNSNVELKTWLEALGSDGMSKEANEAILQNIENKYLKGVQKPKSDITVTPTTPSQPGRTFKVLGKEKP